MHNSVQNLNSLSKEIKEISKKTQLKTIPKIIAITKTFSIDKITPLIKADHIHFGENKLQEAQNKWIDLKSKYKQIKLHMVGKLQSNKAKKAVELFDYIHSLDNLKLANKISIYEKELNKKIKLFIQVNVAEEPQKSGISLNEIESFYNYCTNDLSLNIIGLMCLPPISSDSKKYFDILYNLSKKLGLDELSMGMSDDYEKAILSGSTYIRLGTKIFGERKI